MKENNETRQAVYDRNKMKSFTLKLKKELIEEFKKNIEDDENETTATQFLKRHIEQYNKERRILKMKKIHSNEELQELINEKDYTEDYTEEGLILNVDDIDYLIEKDYINLTESKVIYIFDEEYSIIDNDMAKQLVELNY